MSAIRPELGVAAIGMTRCGMRYGRQSRFSVVQNIGCLRIPIVTSRCRRPTTGAARVIIMKGAGVVMEGEIRREHSPNRQTGGQTAAPTEERLAPALQYRYEQIGITSQGISITKLKSLMQSITIYLLLIEMRGSNPCGLFVSTSCSTTTFSLPPARVGIRCQATAPEHVLVRL